MCAEAAERSAPAAPDGAIAVKASPPIGPATVSRSGPLRIANVKNMGKNLAPKVLRISPRSVGPLACTTSTSVRCDYTSARGSTGAAGSTGSTGSTHTHNAPATCTRLPSTTPTLWLCSSTESDPLAGQIRFPPSRATILLEEVSRGGGLCSAKDP